MPTDGWATGLSRGSITASIRMPPRPAPEQVFLRLCPPQAAPLRGVRVDGQPWPDFDPARELVRLKNLTGQVAVEADYGAARP